MTTTYESIANIRVPGTQDLQWQIPLNENWRILASAANNLHANIAWFSGLAASDNGSNILGLALGVILNGNTPVNVSATTKTIPSGEGHYVYCDSAGTITNSQTIPLTEMTVLYFVQNNAGVLKISDLRKKGGFTLPTPSATDEGYKAKINSSGVWATAKTYGKQQFPNGKLDHWQRGTSFTANAYSADDISIILIGTTGTFSKQTFSVGSEINGCKNYFRCAISSVAGAGNIAAFRISIEDVTKFSGNGKENIYVSFYAKADSNRSFAIEGQQHFGNGGSAPVNTINPQKFSLTSSWQEFKAKFTLPSISGKTIGTTSTYSRLDFFIWLDAGSNYNARTVSLGQQSGIFDFANFNVVSGEETFYCNHYNFDESLLQAKRRYEIVYVMHDTSAIYNTVRHVTKTFSPTITWSLDWGAGAATWSNVSLDSIFLAAMPTAGYGKSKIILDSSY